MALHAGADRCKSVCKLIPIHRTGGADQQKEIGPVLADCHLQPIEGGSRAGDPIEGDADGGILSATSSRLEMGQGPLDLLDDQLGTMCAIPLPVIACSSAGSALSSAAFGAAAVTRRADFDASSRLRKTGCDLSSSESENASFDASPGVALRRATPQGAASSVSRQFLPL